MHRLHPRVASRLARGNPESSGLHVYYDLDRWLPFFRRKYAGSRVIDVCAHSRWWCDPRPATPRDLELLEEGVRGSLGDDAARIILRFAERSLLMVNTDEAGVADQVWEFIANGVRLGTLHYDIVRGKPVFIPGPLAAHLLLHEGLLEERLWSGGRLVEAVETVVLRAPDGRMGVAVPLEGRSTAMVVDEWSVDARLVEEAVSAPRRSLFDAYQANIEHIETLVEKTRRAVEWLEGRLGRRGVLGFSGGKDSLLALHLLVEAGSRLTAFYSHIEHGDPPHIPRFVEETASKLGVELVVNVNDWEYVEGMLKAFGMPVRGYRWCTQVFKIAPLMNYLASLDRDRVVSYTGSRSYETLRRGLKPATYVDVEHRVLVHAVPYKWPRFLEMLALEYRFRARLPPDYTLGFERISCVTCPNKSVYELRLSERLYPDDWEPWRPYIRQAAENIAAEGIDAALEVHAWRLALQPAELIAVAEVAGFQARPRLPGPRRPPRRPGGADYERAARTVKLLYPDARLDGPVFEAGGCRVRLDPERGVWLEAGRFGACATLMKTLYASAYCVSCRACIPRCPADAITGMPLQIDAERCKGPECRVCVETCPLAWGAVDMALANLYLGYRRALSRLQRLREAKGRVYVEKAKAAEEEVYRTKVAGVGGGRREAEEAGGGGGQARGEDWGRPGGGARGARGGPRQGGRL